MVFGCSRLLLMAEQARQHTHPTGFTLALPLTADNRIFTGCNVENSSYGLTVCAERAAVFNAVSAGKKDFLALAVISDGEGYCRPCGACRQVIREFGSDIQIIMASKYRQYEIKKISELLPEGFEF